MSTNDTQTSYPPMPPRTLSRRTFLRGMLGASAAGMLGACSSSATTPTSNSTTNGAAGGAKEPVTISMWTHDSLYTKFFAARGEEWKQTRPEYDITFNFQQVPEVFTKVLANLAARLEVPDLIGIEQGAFPQFMKDDIIEQKFVDLTPRIGSERSAFVEGSWTKFIHKGKIYGVDSGLCASVLYYQPALLEQAGVELPTTWEDTIGVGEALAKQGTAFMAFQGEANDCFTQLFWQRGGTYFDQNSNFVLNEPQNREMALEVLTFIQEGIDKQFIKFFSNADFWAPPIYAAYEDGSVNGIVMPDWYGDAQIKASAPDMAGRWRVAAMPRWRNGGLKTTAWGGTGFAIYQGAKHIDLVWDLLHYTYMTAESQVKRYEELKYFPTMTAALEDPRVAGVTDPYYGGQQVGQIFADIASDVPQWYQSPVRGPLITALNAQLNRFYTGQITAEQAVDGVVDITQREARFLV